MSSPDSNSSAVASRWIFWAGLAVAVGALTGGYLFAAREPERVVASVTAPIQAPASVMTTPIAPVPIAPAPIAPAPVAPAPIAPAPAALIIAPADPAPAAPVSTIAAPAPIAAPVEAQAPSAVSPSFDVVRVSPQGNAVIAGRAEPGADVVVFDGTQEVARTRADRRGEFVALPAIPLAEGGRALTLASRDGSGAELKSEGSVIVVVPPQAAANPVPATVGPVAVLVPDTAPPRVLQAAPAGGGAVTLDIIDYDDKGAIRFAGRAATATTVRVYIDNGAVGDGQVDGAGGWTVTPSGVVEPGVHTVRVDSLDSGGRVLARVELPFQRAAIASSELAGGRMVVQPGQNLWRIARGVYGRGVQYTVIYLANREQIRDPRLIYPGQAFALPAVSR